MRTLLTISILAALSGCMSSEQYASSPKCGLLQLLPCSMMPAGATVPTVQDIQPVAAPSSALPRTYYCHAQNVGFNDAVTCQ